jgi:hypothetical protein
MLRNIPRDVPSNSGGQDAPYLAKRTCFSIVTNYYDIEAQRMMSGIEEFFNPDRIIAIIGVVIAVVAAVAAIYAAVYAKAAPTRDDLARVEENTAHLEEVKASIVSLNDRMLRQQKHDALISRANHVPVTVSGGSPIRRPLRLFLQTADQSVFFSRVELFNEHLNKFGFGECKRNDPGEGFVTILDGDVVENWKNRSTRTEAWTTTRGVLRLYMRFEGSEEEIYREIAVSLITAERHLEAGSLISTTCLRVEGTA